MSEGLSGNVGEEAEQQDIFINEIGAQHIQWKFHDGLMIVQLGLPASGSLTAQPRDKLLRFQDRCVCPSSQKLLVLSMFMEQMQIPCTTEASNKIASKTSIRPTQWRHLKVHSTFTYATLRANKDRDV